MAKSILRLVAGTLLAMSTPAVGNEAEVHVDVPGGVIQGERLDGGSLVFRGIPFAAPPINELRWRAPQPVEPWEGIRFSPERSAACPQNDFGWNHRDYLTAREDCLTLDIRTPSLTGRRPVMVWVHGGSNRAGSAGDTVLSSITDHGVVLVAIQYRLGILGFLAPRGAALEAQGHAGNYGLMDQIAALRWVRENIERFGGDPDNVTIFGESAGAQDVSLLLAAHPARGLFHKAIMQSGTPGFGMVPRPIEDAFALADQVDTLLETGGDIEALRTRSIASLLEADRTIEDAAIANPNDFVWLRPTIDGHVLSETPEKLLEAAHPVPVIIGTNRVEFGPSPGSVELSEYFRAWFGSNSADAERWYLDPDRVRNPRSGHIELEIATDVIFRCPAIHLSELLSERGWPVWRYEFDATLDGSLTSHAAEIAWVLGSNTLGEAARGTSLASYWTNLAKSGDPNGDVPRWPAAGKVGERFVSFDERGVTAHRSEGVSPCSLIDAL